MKNLILIVLLMTFNTELIVFDFDKETNINQWYQTNDDVMGGISSSKMLLDKNGNGVFTGNVSIENNGGFAMTRLPVKIELTADLKKIVLHVKGDGKEYQLRIKSNNNTKYWYIHSFKTSGSMQKIEIALNDFYPSFRGYKLDIENFSANNIEEIAILIGNKKNESFKLVIDKISII